MRDKTKMELRILELETALSKVAKWESHSTIFAVDYGFNGVRDVYRNVAYQALESKAHVS